MAISEQSYMAAAGQNSDVRRQRHKTSCANGAPTASGRIGQSAYKGGFGFSPMLCFADATGVALADMLRPGNAGANCVVDHFTVLDQTVAQLPAEIAVGLHPQGDQPDPTRQQPLAASTATQW
jgi:hypothetical protein